jgi:hypothetical protein
MKTHKFVYGDKGLDDMLSYLTNLSNSLESTSDTVVDALSKVAEKEINERVSKLDLDDNHRGSVEITNITNGKKVSYTGSDVMYIEFGTGMVGKASPHPLAPEYDWEYYIDTIFKKVSSKTGQAGWYYNGKFHIGIPAGRCVYNTGIDIRQKVRQVVKENLKL